MEILVAEDDEDQRLFMQAFLQRLGHTVRTARNGADAIALAAVHLPNLVLTDLSMPEVDGLVATREILELPGAAALPIIVISGLFGDRVWSDRAQAAGCFVCLGKPVDFPKLEEVIRKLASAIH